MGSGSTVAVCLAAILTASTARAEESATQIISARVIDRAIASVQPRISPAAAAFALPRQSASSTHTGRRVVWTSIGAVGGFFAGAYLGAWIENAASPCGCDDPGLKGALIGMPIGAIAGGVTGFILSK
jgi:hypothetical protein